MNVPPALEDRWDDVIADMEATADEYREQGWEAVVVHPGDVTARVDEATLDVMVSGSEFEAVRQAVEDASIKEFHVYGAYQGGVYFRLVAAEASDVGLALCVPTYLTESDDEELEEAAEETGTLFVRLRPLDDSDRVEVTLDDPDVFFDA